MRKIKLWLHTPQELKQHYREACSELLLARMQLLFLPFRRIAPKLGNLDQTGSFDTLDEIALTTVRPVARSIKTMAKYVPWQSKCLVQAMAGKRMLSKRGIETTLYLGVNKQGSDMKAHAWLRVGPHYITGGNGEPEYTVVRTFHNPGQRHSC